MNRLHSSPSLATRRGPAFRQGMRGMGTISLIIVLAAAALALTCALKMLPVYVENMNIRSILNGIEKDYLATSEPTSRSELKTKIAKRFNINQINSLTANDVVVEKTKEGYNVIANYEARVALLGNIDVVMKFEDNQVQLPHR